MADEHGRHSQDSMEEAAVRFSLACVDALFAAADLRRQDCYDAILDILAQMDEPPRPPEGRREPRGWSRGRS